MNVTIFNKINKMKYFFMSIKMIIINTRIKIKIMTENNNNKTFLRQRMVTLDIVTRFSVH